MGGWWRIGRDGCWRFRLGRSLGGSDRPLPYRGTLEFPWLYLLLVVAGCLLKQGLQVREEGSLVGRERERKSDTDKMKVDSLIEEGFEGLLADLLCLKVDRFLSRVDVKQN